MKTAAIETSKGTIHLSLFDANAPKTVANFVDLAKKGFYDGTTFHRVIPGFMIQGGDPLSKTLPKGDPRVGTGGPGYRIACETAGNPEKHVPGTLSMAHAGKDTGGSQFFITHVATPHLDGKHTVFGRVVSAADKKVVDAIAGGDKIVRVTIQDAPTG
jgi:peptidyl-prolyl cis-trans isomerase B (cyclophilin B)